MTARKRKERSDSETLKRAGYTEHELADAAYLQRMLVITSRNAALAERERDRLRALLLRTRAQRT